MKQLFIECLSQPTANSKQDCHWQTALNSGQKQHYEPGRFAAGLDAQREARPWDIIKSFFIGHTVEGLTRVPIDFENVIAHPQSGQGRP